MKRFTSSAALSFLCLCLTACMFSTPKKHVQVASLTTESNAVKYQLLTDAIQAPVQLLSPPDETARLFVCDLSGKVYILKNGHPLPVPFIDISRKLEQKDTAPDVRAMFSMAFHPHFAKNKKFYICYNAPASKKSDKCMLRISEFKARDDNADVADVASERTVFELEDHNAGEEDCAIAFGPDGYLYISTGAHATPADAQKAQDLHSLSGKMLRIDVDKTPYAVPADNPFIGKANARPEVWAYGFRRVWRFSFDPKTHQLFAGDVGDKMQEEIDVLQRGGNYGWPIEEGDSIKVKNTKAPTSTFIMPVNTYTHKDGICVIGGSIYRGAELPFLKDKYVFADYTSGLFCLTENTPGRWKRQAVKLVNPSADPFLIFSLDQDKNGDLYVSGVRNTHAGFKGAVYKIVHG